MQDEKTTDELYIENLKLRKELILSKLKHQSQALQSVAGVVEVLFERVNQVIDDIEDTLET